MYTGQQTDAFFSGHMCYRRIDNLLLSMGTNEGTFNLVLEGAMKALMRKKMRLTKNIQVRKKGWSRKKMLVRKKRQ